MSAAVEFALAAIALLGARQVHVHYFPWKNCPWCGGSKRINSGSAHRDCGRCGSTGRVRRLGAPRVER